VTSSEFKDQIFLVPCKRYEICSEQVLTILLNKNEHKKLKDAIDKKIYRQTTLGEEGDRLF
jgi:hypothetical protein